MGEIENWSRREFLVGGAASAAAAALGIGCSSAPASTAGSPTTAAPGATTGSAPAGTLAPQSLQDIDHVVIFFQENRSFDHYFGVRKGVRGFADSAATQTYQGKSVFHQPYDKSPDGYLLPYHFDTAVTSSACSKDPDHSWIGQHGAWNGGQNDGFAGFIGPVSMGYFTRADLPYYYALADEYTLCDQYFCSVLGPTQPNRLYSMSASVDAAGTHGGPVAINGLGPYSWTTYPERLQQAGISWRIYHEADDYDDNVLKYFKAFQGLSPGDPLHDAAMVDRSATAFMDDARSGNLPQVSWIVAPEAKSEHPSYAPAVGEDVTQQVLAAIAANPKLYAKTLFILSYDENGGFFDHVVPPTAPPGTPDEMISDKPIGLGFRVPTIMVSPWSRGGRVASQVYDHTSTLLLLEKRFGVEVPNLSAWRRETVGDMTEALDFAHPDTSVPTLPKTAERAVAATEACKALPAPTPPTTQAIPATEA
jgi:phospholipase C